MDQGAGESGSEMEAEAAEAPEVDAAAYSSGSVGPTPVVTVSHRPEEVVETPWPMAVVTMSHCPVEEAGAAPATTASTTAPGSCHC